MLQDSAREVAVLLLSFQAKLQRRAEVSTAAAEHRLAVSHAQMLNFRGLLFTGPFPRTGFIPRTAPC